MSAKLIEQLMQAPGLLGDEHIASLCTLNVTHNLSLFAWAVQEIVRIGDDTCSYGDDVVSVSRALAACANNADLLREWIAMFRKRAGLSTIASDRIRQLLDAQIIDISTPDGFRIVAGQFKQRSPMVTMETTDTKSIYRPSTPPAVVGTLNMHQ